MPVTCENHPQFAELKQEVLFFLHDLKSPLSLLQALSSTQRELDRGQLKELLSEVLGRLKIAIREQESRLRQPALTDCATTTDIFLGRPMTSTIDEILRGSNRDSNIKLGELTPNPDSKNPSTMRLEFKPDDNLMAALNRDFLESIRLEDLAKGQARALGANNETPLTRAEDSSSSPTEPGIAWTLLEKEERDRELMAQLNRDFLEADRRIRISESLQTVLKKTVGKSFLDLLRHQETQLICEIPLKLKSIHCPFPAADLQRTLKNILINAAQAVATVPQPRRIYYRVSLVKALSTRQPASLQIVIEDNGPGLPQQMHSHWGTLGKTFGKADGTGVGLYQAKTFAAKFGGEISVGISPQGLPLRPGTKVSVTLPLHLPKKNLPN